MTEDPSLVAQSIATEQCATESSATSPSATSDGIGRRRRSSPTMLVHEAYLELVDQSSIARYDRVAFLGVAASAMRQILVDCARACSAAKRGDEPRHERLRAGRRTAEARREQVDRERKRPAVIGR